MQNKDNSLMLISINSYYARQIFNGTKKYEFRKSPIKPTDLNREIFIYSAKEDKSIIGTLKVSEVIKGDLDYILNETGYINRLDKNEIIDYFGDKKICYALKLCDIHRFNTPIKLSELRQIAPKISLPQYFRYIDKNSALGEYIMQKAYNESAIQEKV